MPPSAARAMCSLAAAIAGKLVALEWSQSERNNAGDNLVGIALARYPFPSPAME